MKHLPGAAVALLLLLLWAARAEAYPQWQLSTGAARCNQCHYAPSGGGLLTSYGRDAAGEELSTFGGNGAFLHGLPLITPAELGGWSALQSKHFADSGAFDQIFSESR